MKPIFGDAKAIERLDPRKLILVDGIRVPREILTCRFCKGDLFAEFDDYWTTETEWGAGTIRLECVNEPDISDRDYSEYDDWVNSHTYDNQSDQMEDEAKVARWLTAVYAGFKHEC